LNNKYFGGQNIPVDINDFLPWFNNMLKYLSDVENDFKKTLKKRRMKISKKKNWIYIRTNLDIVIIIDDLNCEGFTAIHKYNHYSIRPHKIYKINVIGKFSNVYDKIVEVYGPAIKHKDNFDDLNERMNYLMDVDDILIINSTYFIPKILFK